MFEIRKFTGMSNRNMLITCPQQDMFINKDNQWPSGA